MNSFLSWLDRKGMTVPYFMKIVFSMSLMAFCAGFLLVGAVLSL